MPSRSIYQEKRAVMFLGHLFSLVLFKKNVLPIYIEAMPDRLGELQAKYETLLHFYVHN